MGQFPNILCKVFALFGVRHIAYDMKIGRNFVGEIEWDLSCTGTFSLLEILAISDLGIYKTTMT